MNILRVRRPSGRLETFMADLVEMDHGLITVTGYWGDDETRQRRRYTFQSAQVLEIRWAVVT